MEKAIYEIIIQHVFGDSKISLFELINVKEYVLLIQDLNSEFFLIPNKNNSNCFYISGKGDSSKLRIVQNVNNNQLKELCKILINEFS